MRYRRAIKQAVKRVLKDTEKITAVTFTGANARDMADEFHWRLLSDGYKPKRVGKVVTVIGGFDRKDVEYSIRMLEKVYEFGYTLETP